MLTLYYYCTDSPIEVRAMGDVDMRHLSRTHKEVHSESVTDIKLKLKYQYLGELFRRFNDDEKNPLAKSAKPQKNIRTTLHTSMSVGDVVHFKTPLINEYWVCRPFGWGQLQ